MANAARKTATVQVSHIFGTRLSHHWRVMYRGKTVKHGDVNGTANQTAREAAQWAHANGFTHCNISYT